MAKQLFKWIRANLVVSNDVELEAKFVNLLTGGIHILFHCTTSRGVLSTKVSQLSGHV